MEKLWQFMQVDMETDRFGTKMQQSENRQKLISKRNFLMEQQSNMKRLENDVAAMQDRLEAVKDEAARLEKVLSGLSEEISQNPPKTAQEAKERTDAVRKVFDSLKRYESEIQKMRKDADTKDRQQKEIRVRAAKAKQEYDQVKKVYDVEFHKDTQMLNELRAKTDREAEKIDPQLMKKYRAIKQHCTPPMAKLVNGQCSGCFMSLPSATLLMLKQDGAVIECDNCGRILYTED